MSELPTNWEALARREYEAARIGYGTWARFVREAERLTRLPWSEVRERLNMIHKRDGLPPPGCR